MVFEEIRRALCFLQSICSALNVFKYNRSVFACLLCQGYVCSVCRLAFERKCDVFDRGVVLRTYFQDAYIAKRSVMNDCVVLMVQLCIFRCALCPCGALCRLLYSRIQINIVVRHRVLLAARDNPRGLHRDNDRDCRILRKRVFCAVYRCSKVNCDTSDVRRVLRFFSGPYALTVVLITKVAPRIVLAAS